MLVKYLTQALFMCTLLLNYTNLFTKYFLGVVSAVYFSTAVNYERKMLMKLTTGLATQVPVSDFVTKQHERQQR
jgi:hypothetical protein